MSTPGQDDAYEIGAIAARLVAGMAVGAVAASLVAGAPTALAAITVLLVGLTVGMVAGRQAAVPAAIVACYVFGDQHLADRHGVLGTSSVAITFLFVQALAIGGAVVGDRWRGRTRARSVAEASADRFGAS